MEGENEVQRSWVINLRSYSKQEAEPGFTTSLSDSKRMILTTMRPNDFRAEKLYFNSSVWQVGKLRWMEGKVRARTAIQVSRLPSHQHINFLCKSILGKGVRSKEGKILIKPSFLLKTISGYARGIWIYSVSIIHAVYLISPPFPI